VHCDTFLQTILFQGQSLFSHPLVTGITPTACTVEELQVVVLMCPLNERDASVVGDVVDRLFNGSLTFTVE